jgi:hypothetical protein
LFFRGSIQGRVRIERIRAMSSVQQSRLPRRGVHVASVLGVTFFGRKPLVNAATINVQKIQNARLDKL